MIVFLQIYFKEIFFIVISVSEFGYSLIYNYSWNISSIIGIT